MKKDKVLGRILKFTKPYRFYIAGSTLFAILSVLCTLFIPILTGTAIDYIIKENEVDFSSILFILEVMLLIIIIGALFGWLMNYFNAKATYKTVKDLRTKAFENVLKVEISYIDKNSHGDILTRIVTDIDQVGEGLLQGFTQLFSGIATIVITLIFMISINYIIALIVIILTPLSLFVANFIAKGSFKTFKMQSQIKGDMGGLLNEMFENQKVVIAFEQQNKSIEKFERINQDLYNYGVRAQFFSALANPCTRFVNAIVYAVVAVFGGVAAIETSLSVGNLYTFLSYASQYTKPFNEISGVATELQNSFASARRVFDLIDAEILSEDQHLEQLSNIKGEVIIKNVNFSYSSEKSLIQNFNLHVKPGETIAIVGPTGCGKTTLINLLMRFYDVNEGVILVDGRNIQDITRDSLRKEIGMVLQDTWLFKGTVYENIAYAKSNATKEEVIEAAKKAYAHSFIMRLPQGYDTVISDDEGLSAGQKQLLCIARVMLKLPPMLILDEATSNIDTRTEIMIQKAFSKLMKNRTSFVIAHRLSTIKEADLILVMKDGNIIEQGSHQELLNLKGFYSELYESQFKVN